MCLALTKTIWPNSFSKTQFFQFFPSKWCKYIRAIFKTTPSYHMQLFSLFFYFLKIPKFSIFSLSRAPFFWRNIFRFNQIIILFYYLWKIKWKHFFNFFYNYKPNIFFFIFKESNTGLLFFMNLIIQSFVIFSELQTILYERFLQEYKYVWYMKYSSQSSQTYWKMF